jgi:hypothetical protein
MRLVPGVGIEPTRPYGHGILSPERLPVPPPRLSPFYVVLLDFRVFRVKRL